MHPVDKKLNAVLASYDYALPESAIAQKPASPRDHARLMIVSKTKKSVTDVIFSDITRYLPPHSLIVLNDTKVIPARLKLKKQTGGAVEVLYLDHRKATIHAMVSPGLKPGTKLLWGARTVFTVVSARAKIYNLHAHMTPDRIIPLFQRHGAMPVPPYIKHSPLNKNQMKQAYQTVFARLNGSVAAPTASLHFTRRLIKKLQRQGHEIVRITLHVNLGTFAPLDEENIKTKRLHEERYYISEQAAARITRAITQNQPIIACGTTVTRTLESAATVRRNATVIRHGWRTTDLFIAPGFRFRVINGLITNFHLPKSSLLMLVAALAGKNRIMNVYRKAVASKYRFYSFGDAMFIS